MVRKKDASKKLVSQPSGQYSQGFLTHRSQTRQRSFQRGLAGSHSTSPTESHTAAHTGKQGPFTLGAALGADSAIENGRSFFVGYCGVKYDSFPACLDAAIPFHEQTAFWHRHYSWTAPRAFETLLTDVRAFYLYGRRICEREKQRAFRTSTHALCVDVLRRRGPAGTRSPAAGSCAASVSFTVCHRCVEVQRRTIYHFHAPCCADSIVCTRCRSIVLSSAVNCRS